MLGHDDPTFVPPSLAQDASLTFNPAKPAAREVPAGWDSLAETVAPSEGASGGPGAGGQPPGEGYALERLIGVGGFGEVWRASQVSLRRTVAVKVMRGENEGSARSERCAGRSGRRR
jgi:hypothetical protein